jgi:hypothetical protein
MMRSSGLAGLAMLAGLSSATAQRSTITRDAFRARAASLVFTYLAESRAPSAASWYSRTMMPNRRRRWCRIFFAWRTA